MNLAGLTALMVTAVLATPHAARAQSDWVVLWADSTESWSVNRTQIISEGGDRYRFWTKVIYTQPRVISQANGPIDSEIIHEQVQCGPELKSQAFGFTDYLSDSVVFSDETAAALDEMKTLIPDSRGEYYYGKVCALAHRRGRR